MGDHRKLTKTNHCSKGKTWNTAFQYWKKYIYTIYIYMSYLILKCSFSLAEWCGLKTWLGGNQIRSFSLIRPNKFKNRGLISVNIIKKSKSSQHSEPLSHFNVNYTIIQHRQSYWGTKSAEFKGLLFTSFTNDMAEPYHKFKCSSQVW